MKLDSLSPNLIADDVNASVEFYKKHFGFNLVVSVPETGQYGWAMIQRDNVVLMFQSLKSMQEDMPSLKMDKKGCSGTFFIEMTGVEELYKSAKKNKLDIALDWRVTFYGKQEFGIKDPNGYYMVFAEDK